MKELKSKKTGRVSVLTDDEYADMLATGIDMKRWVVTDVRMRNIISAKIEPKVEPIKKKK